MNRCQVEYGVPLVVPQTITFCCTLTSGVYFSGFQLSVLHRGEFFIATFARSGILKVGMPRRAWVSGLNGVVSQLKM